jgi:hypothetical protein
MVITMKGTTDPRGWSEETGGYGRVKVPRRMAVKVGIIKSGRYGRNRSRMRRTTFGESKEAKNSPKPIESISGRTVSRSVQNCDHAAFCQRGEILASKAKGWVWIRKDEWK